MLFSVTLYIALAIFLIGLIYKVFTWFRYNLSGLPGESSVAARMGGSVKGVLSSIFSPRIFSLLKVFVLDVLLQARALKRSFSRWLLHMLIFWGFMLLLLMHALDGIVTENLFSGYYSTVDPYQFLRNLFGAMVIVGIAMAVYRRFTVKGMRATTRTMDIYAIIILAVIMISGVVLEASKIVSHAKFEEMVLDYSLLEPEETDPLKAYWERDFGVVFPTSYTPAAPEVLEEGRTLHMMSCAECHSKPQSAFMSYGVAKMIKPVAVDMTEARVDIALNYIHFLACFIGLAYLPFSKFFHIFSSPVSLMANEVMKPEEAEAVNAATRRAMELDACTHCAACSVRCSVGPVFDQISNPNILPSEKLISLKKMMKGEDLSDRELKVIREGACICTNCYQCTEVCPVGINLQDLWLNIREELSRRGYPELVAHVRDAAADLYHEGLQDKDEILRPDPGSQQHLAEASNPPGKFSACFECQTCTQVCPVVSHYENPGEVLHLMPHQIMHSLGLGLGDEVLGAGMVWDCVTCYLCQEHCPQGVDVADILYELRCAAFKQARARETA